MQEEKRFILKIQTPDAIPGEVFIRNRKEGVQDVYVCERDKSVFYRVNPGIAKKFFEPLCDKPLQTKRTILVQDVKDNTTFTGTFI